RPQRPPLSTAARSRAATAPRAACRRGVRAAPPAPRAAPRAPPAVRAPFAPPSAPSPPDPAAAASASAYRQALPRRHLGGEQSRESGAPGAMVLALWLAAGAPPPARGAHREPHPGKVRFHIAAKALPSSTIPVA